MVILRQRGSRAILKLRYDPNSKLEQEIYKVMISWSALCRVLRPLFVWIWVSWPIPSSVSGCFKNVVGLLSLNGTLPCWYYFIVLVNIFVLPNITWKIKLLSFFSLNFDVNHLKFAWHFTRWTSFNYILHDNSLLKHLRWQNKQDPFNKINKA